MLRRMLIRITCYIAILRIAVGGRWPLKVSLTASTKLGSMVDHGEPYFFAGEAQHIWDSPVTLGGHGLSTSRVISC